MQPRRGRVWAPSFSSCLADGSLVSSCRRRVIRGSDGDFRDHQTQPLWPPGSGKARFSLWFGKVARRWSFLTEEAWKAAILFLSWSPYGRLPTELHRMRACNCLRNKSSAFIARVETTWPMISGRLLGLPEDRFHCLHFSLCTRGSEFCQRM